jgi:hypothetical protein
MWVCAVAVLFAGVGTVHAAGVMYGSDQFGNLFTVNLGTGAGTLVGTEINFGLSTEIEYDNLGAVMYSEETDGGTGLHTLNTANGLSTGFVNHPFGALNGLEFVGNTLFGTFIPGGGAPSQLVTVNTATGALTPVSPALTGFGPISGLAYDAANNVMYGVTAGGGPGQLVTINLGTGIATPGPFMIDATGLQYDHVGALEFDGAGNLYAGVAQNGSVNPGWLVQVNPASGLTTAIGPSGIGGPTGLPDSFTGLTFVIPLPAAAWAGLLLLGGCGGARLIRRRRAA